MNSERLQELPADNSLRFSVRVVPGAAPGDPLLRRTFLTVANFMRMGDEVVGSNLPIDEALKLLGKTQTELEELGRVGEVVMERYIPPELNLG